MPRHGLEQTFNVAFGKTLKKKGTVAAREVTQMKHMFAILLLIALAACAAPETTPAPDQAAGNVVAEQATEYRIEAFQFGFDPDPLVIPLGEPARLVFTSRDVEHGVVIAEFGVSTYPFGPGEEGVIEFTPDRAGEFSYRCNVFCGQGHRGMTGTLIVE